MKQEGNTKPLSFRQVMHAAPQDFGAAAKDMAATLRRRLKAARKIGDPDARAAAAQQIIDDSSRLLREARSYSRMPAPRQAADSDDRNAALAQTAATVGLAVAVPAIAIQLNLLSFGGFVQGVISLAGLGLATVGTAICGGIAAGEFLGPTLGRACHAMVRGYAKLRAFVCQKHVRQYKKFAAIPIAKIKLIETRATGVLHKSYHDTTRRMPLPDSCRKAFAGYTNRDTSPRVLRVLQGGQQDAPAETPRRPK